MNGKTKLKSTPIMIRSLLFAAVFIGMHWLVVKVLPESKRLPERAPIDWTQNFLLSPDKPARIVAGSSYADRLTPHNSDPDTLMININGGSAFDALAMLDKIKDTEYTPSLMAIEINRLTVIEPKDWLVEMLAEPSYSAWNSVPMLREKNRPMSIAGWPIHVLMNKLYLTGMERLGPPGSAANIDVLEPDPKLLEMNIEDQKKYLEDPVDDEKLAAIVYKLEKAVSKLQKNGCQVVFFHMPIHAELNFLDGPRSVFKAIRQAFPEDRYDWVPEVDPGDYIFTDAVHMDSPSASRYMKFLENAISDLSGSEG